MYVPCARLHGLHEQREEHSTCEAQGCTGLGALYESLLHFTGCRRAANSPSHGARLAPGQSSGSSNLQALCVLQSFNGAASEQSRVWACSLPSTWTARRAAARTPRPCSARFWAARSRGSTRCRTPLRRTRCASRSCLCLGCAAAQASGSCCAACLHVWLQGWQRHAHDPASAPPVFSSGHSGTGLCQSSDHTHARTCMWLCVCLTHAHGDVCSPCLMTSPSCENSGVALYADCLFNTKCCCPVSPPSCLSSYLSASTDVASDS